MKIGTNAIRCGIFIVLILVITSCGKRDLDREMATDIISRQLGNSTTDIMISFANLTNYGGQLGFFHSLSFANSLGDEGGENFLRDEVGEVLIPELNNNHQHSNIENSYTITLKNDVLTSIRVTGISAPDAKSDDREVLFEVTYENIPKLVRLFAYQGYTGRALLRRYDDGWRFEELLEISHKDVFPPREIQDEFYVLSQLVSKRRSEVAQARSNFHRRIDAACTSRELLSHFSFGYNDATGSIVDVYVNDASLYMKFSRRNGDFSSDRNYVFSDYPRDGKNLPAVIDGGILYIGSRYPGESYSYFPGRFPSNTTEFIETVNDAFSTWKRNNASLISECPNSLTWGCTEEPFFKHLNHPSVNIGECNKQASLAADQDLAANGEPDGVNGD